LAIVAALAAAAAGPRRAAQADNASRDPILILVSFDGWRWDYMDRYPTPNLRALAARGVRAERMIPSFPVLTYPNHYTLVTGLYPEHHGIVANNIIDERIGPRFSMSAETATDSRWWGGVPLWVSVVRDGRRAAPTFWPGSNVEIAGVRPTRWEPFAIQVTTYERVRRALQLLAAPSEQQPSFVTLYFDEVDTAGHDFGVDSPQLRTAAAHLDDALGMLVAGVHGLGLDDRATIVVVSDHGMTSLSEDRVVYLEDYVDQGSIEVTEWNGLLAAAPKNGDARALYRTLDGAHPALDVYLREQMPARFHYRDNARIAPVIGIPRLGWAVTTRQRLAAKKLNAGTHGFDPDAADMGALFVAAGPGVRRGAVIPPFRNVDVYSFLCSVLGITPEHHDGSAATIGLIMDGTRAAASEGAWTRQQPQRLDP
jgi:predicted AlkP superfamily pyrophosphatase or phosphodiesterase